MSDRYRGYGRSLHTERVGVKQPERWRSRGSAGLQLLTSWYRQLACFSVLPQRSNSRLDAHAGWGLVVNADRSVRYHWEPCVTGRTLLPQTTQETADNCRPTTGARRRRHSHTAQHAPTQVLRSFLLLSVYYTPLTAFIALHCVCLLMFLLPDCLF